MSRPRLLPSALLFLALPICAEQPTLDTVLTRLQQNSTIYTLSLPNFFVDETFTSQELFATRPQKSITTVSTLRILRTPGDARLGGKSAESREVHTVNNKPAHGNHVKGPIVINGAFDTALTMFTASHVSCFIYKLLPPPDPQHLLLSFMAKEPVGACPASILGETGRTLLDLQTMQPIHIDRTVPHAEGAGRGTFIWSIDFASTMLGGRAFNMPTSIHTQLLNNYSPHIFKTDATYTNYHRLAVSSTVLPPTDHPESEPTKP